MLSDSNHKGCMIKPSTHLYKDYVIPKVDKKSNKGCTNKVPDYSREHSEILAEVKNSYLDVTYNLSSHWDYEGLELIDNHQYRTQFSNKRQQLRNHIRKDIAEQFAFCFVESDIIRYVCRQGKPNQPDLYLLLGDQKQGVNLCRHADVCLQWATLRLKSHIKVLVYKIFPGIVHHIELRKSVSAPYLEPTPNHDSHSSKQPARLEQSLYDKIQNSNIFLYEYDDEDCLPKKMPSNCLPYAIISLRKKGTLPSIPRLQSETKKKSKRQTLRVPQETFGKNNELGESTNVVDDDHISNHEQSQSAEKNAVLRDDVEKGLSKDQNSNIIMEKRCEKETGKSSKSRWQRTELKSSSYERRVIHEKLLESFLDPNYVLSSDWKYNGMELIENTVLRKKFRRKKEALKKKMEYVKEEAAFCFTTPEELDFVCKSGRSENSNFHQLLGDDKCGLNLSQHPDVCLKWAMRTRKQTVKILVYKVLIGCVKKVVPGSSAKPTEKHDCYLSNRAPRKDSHIYKQLARSLVYFYEYDNESLLKKMPSSCLPYAVVNFRSNKKYFKHDSPTEKPVVVSSKPEQLKNKSGKSSNNNEEKEDVIFIDTTLQTQESYNPKKMIDGDEHFLQNTEKKCVAPLTMAQQENSTSTNVDISEQLRRYRKSNEKEKDGKISIGTTLQLHRRCDNHKKYIDVDEHSVQKTEKRNIVSSSGKQQNSSKSTNISMPVELKRKSTNNNEEKLVEISVGATSQPYISDFNNGEKIDEHALHNVEKKYDARSSTKQYNSTSVLESSVSREKKQTLETSLISGSQLHKKDDDCDKSNITKGILKNNHGKMHISSSAKHQNNGASSKDCVPDGSVIKKKRSHPHMDSDIVEKSINSEKCVNVQKKHSTQHILLSKPTTVVPNSRAELMGILVSDASKHFSEVTLKKVKKRLPSKHVHSVAKQHCGLSPTLSSDCVSAMLKRKEETNPICGVSQLHEHKDYANTAITDDKCTHEQIVEQKHPPNHITSENEIAGVLPNMQCSYCVPDANEQKTESSISTYLSLQDVNNERKQSKHSTISDQPYSSVSEDIEKEMVGLPIHTHSLKTHNSKCSLGAEEGQPFKLSARQKRPSIEPQDKGSKKRKSCEGEQLTKLSKGPQRCKLGALKTTKYLNSVYHHEEVGEQHTESVISQSLEKIYQLKLTKSSDVNHPMNADKFVSSKLQSDLPCDISTSETSISCFEVGNLEHDTKEIEKASVIFLQSLRKSLKNAWTMHTVNDASLPQEKTIGDEDCNLEQRHGNSGQLNSKLAHRVCTSDSGSHKPGVKGFRFFTLSEQEKQTFLDKMTNESTPQKISKQEKRVPVKVHNVKKVLQFQENTDVRETKLISACEFIISPGKHCASDDDSQPSSHATCTCSITSHGVYNLMPIDSIGTRKVKISNCVSSNVFTTEPRIIPLDKLPYLNIQDPRSKCLTERTLCCNCNQPKHILCEEKRMYYHNTKPYNSCRTLTIENREELPENESHVVALPNLQKSEDGNSGPKSQILHAQRDDNSRQFLVDGNMPVSQAKTELVKTEQLLLQKLKDFQSTIKNTSEIASLRREWQKWKSSVSILESSNSPQVSNKDKKRVNQKNMKELKSRKQFKVSDETEKLPYSCVDKENNELIFNKSDVEFESYVGNHDETVKSLPLLKQLCSVPNCLKVDQSTNKMISSEKSPLMDLCDLEPSSETVPAQAKAKTDHYSNDHVSFQESFSSYCNPVETSVSVAGNNICEVNKIAFKGMMNNFDSDVNGGRKDKCKVRLKSSCKSPPAKMCKIVLEDLKYTEIVTTDSDNSLNGRVSSTDTDSDTNSEIIFRLRRRKYKNKQILEYSDDDDSAGSNSASNKISGTNPEMTSNEPNKMIPISDVANSCAEYLAPTITAAAPSDLEDASGKCVFMYSINTQHPVYKFLPKSKEQTDTCESKPEDYDSDYNDEVWLSSPGTPCLDEQKLEADAFTTGNEIFQFPSTASTKLNDELDDSVDDCSTSCISSTDKDCAALIQTRSGCMHTLLDSEDQEILIENSSIMSSDIGKLPTDTLKDSQFGTLDEKPSFTQIPVVSSSLDCTCGDPLVDVSVKQNHDGSTSQECTDGRDETAVQVSNETNVLVEESDHSSRNECSKDGIKERVGNNSCDELEKVNVVQTNLDSLSKDYNTGGKDETKIKANNDNCDELEISVSSSSSCVNMDGGIPDELIVVDEYEESEGSICSNITDETSGEMIVVDEYSGSNASLNNSVSAEEISIPSFNDKTSDESNDKHKHKAEFENCNSDRGRAAGYADLNNTLKEVLSKDGPELDSNKDTVAPTDTNQNESNENMYDTKDKISKESVNLISSIVCSIVSEKKRSGDLCKDSEPLQSTSDGKESVSSNEEMCVKQPMEKISSTACNEQVRKISASPSKEESSSSSMKGDVQTKMTNSKRTSKYKTTATKSEKDGSKPKNVKEHYKNIGSKGNVYPSWRNSKSNYGQNYNNCGRGVAELGTQTLNPRRDYAMSSVERGRGNYINANELWHTKGMYDERSVSMTPKAIYWDDGASWHCNQGEREKDWSDISRFNRHQFRLNSFEHCSTLNNSTVQDYRSNFYTNPQAPGQDDRFFKNNFCDKQQSRALWNHCNRDVSPVNNVPRPLNTVSPNYQTEMHVDVFSTASRSVDHRAQRSTCFNERAFQYNYGRPRLEHQQRRYFMNTY